MLIPRVAVVIAVAFLAAGPADAASRHHRKHLRARGPAPTLPQGQIYPSRPAWAPEGACFTDEGYGRFLPCDAAGGRAR